MSETPLVKLLMDSIAIESSRRDKKMSAANRQCKSCGELCGDYLCFSCARQEERERVWEIHQDFKRENYDELTD